MVSISRLRYLDGAARAQGPTVVIDVFRAFTTAAHALAKGAEKVVLASGADEARTLAESTAGALLAGEIDGARPDGFDLGNSPAEVSMLSGLTGRTLVLSTTAGTRALLAARAAGAHPVLAGSLVVASATSRALADAATVTLVVSGWNGTDPAEEDEACADLITSLLLGELPDRPSVRTRALEGEGARRLAASTWADPNDLSLCLEMDRFDFAMPASSQDGRVVLVASA